MEPIGMPGQGGPTSEIYRFDDIVVDAGAHTVLRAGQPQTIEPKAFSVLLVLLRHKGELVTRDDLLDDVWGHRHVTPGVLTRVIAQLRHVLGDDSQHPRYIQTQHALGYRFIGLPRRDSDYPDTSMNTVGETEPTETIVAVRQSVPASLKLAANEPHPPNVRRTAYVRFGISFSAVTAERLGYVVVRLLRLPEHDTSNGAAPSLDLRQSRLSSIQKMRVGSARQMTS